MRLTLARVSRKTWLIALLAVCGSVMGVVAVSALWEASSVLEESGDQQATESAIPFTRIRLDHAPPTALEWVSAPAVFSDATVFEGRLFVAGPAGIVEHDEKGKPQRRYRVGLELPAAEPVRLASGLSVNHSGRALYVATAGEGLLIHEKSAAGFEQIRADEASHRDLTTVLPLKTGTVLMGTQKRGVLAYNGKRLAFLHPALSGLHVTALAGDESSLWIGTLDQGILHWHGGRLQRFTEPGGLPDPQVLSIALHGSSTFVGTPMGIAEFRDGRFQRTLAEGVFAQSLEAEEHVLRVAALDEGILEIPRKATRVRPPPPAHEAGPKITHVRRLFTVHHDAYALAEDGLYDLGRSRPGWRPMIKPDGALLADRNISALSVDARGRVWVGYFDRGLDIVDLSGNHAIHIEDQHVFCVNRIVHDTKRRLTGVATANGLVFFDEFGKKQQLLRRDDGLISSHVTDLVFRPDGMTVATPAGITFIDAGGMRSLYAFHGLVNNHVYALGLAGERLLAGTLGGLSVLDAGVVRTGYTTANSELKHNWITAIAPLGDEWLVGTYGAGILKLDAAGRWQQLPEASGRFEVNPNAMAASEQRVYAGTLDRGLYIYDRASGVWTKFIEGLPSVNVTALAVDNGLLYIGTDNGLVRIPEESLRTP